jgi:predicted O-linked N-acetylglucosamine transferase (SPINDLY family)
MNIFHQSDVDFERDGGLIDSIVFDADSHEGKVNTYPALISDHARHRVKTAASEFVLLPTDMNGCADIVRAANLDLLVYPELGADSLTYFLAFSRLARVQALWLGDGDTTGIPTIDYIITSTVDTTPWKYSEKVFRMHGLGTTFIDDYFEVLLGNHHTPFKI